MRTPLTRLVALPLLLLACGGDDTSTSEATPAAASGASGNAAMAGSTGSGASGGAAGGAATGGAATGGAATGGAAAGGSPNGGAAQGGSPPKLECGEAARDAVLEAVREASSCALSCKADCEESSKPFVCPAMGPWASVAHDCADTACGMWDGSYPAVVQGKCSASEATGAAAAKTDAKGAKVVLPDGRRLAPAGNEWLFDEPREEGGKLPLALLHVPKSRFAIVSDCGIDDHVLRAIDLAKLAAGADPVTSRVVFPAPKSLSQGLAIGPDGTIYAGSGAPDSVVRAFTLTAEGKLEAEQARDIALETVAGEAIFPAGLAISPDGKTLVVGQVKGKSLLVYSLEAATYGQRVAELELPAGAIDQVSVVFDPSSSDVVYASIWLGAELCEVTLSTGAVRRIPTGRQPEKLAFIDDRYMVVATSLGDELVVVDRPAAMVVASVPVDPLESLHGSGPTAISFDRQRGRLYVTLSGRNAVSVFDVTTGGAAPTLTHAGMVPTSWWPVDVSLTATDDPVSDSLVVITARGHGTGPFIASQQIGGAEDAMRGTVAIIEAPHTLDLAAQTAAFAAGDAPAALEGAPTVTCPDGADDDFPVPRTNTEGPSKRIDHVVMIVRENKTYDAVLGDLPGADGDKDLVMAPGNMDAIWGNARKIALEFAHGDNFYEDAEQSLQGHYWTAFGRTSDYTEKTWVTTWGRGTRGPLPLQGVDKATWPEEGSIFSWMAAGGVAFDNMGEQLGNTGLDPEFGKGGFVTTSSTKPDIEQACYMAARARVRCDLKPFTYAWYVNDHTFGGATGRPNPAVMIAVNDEATGMFVDALSHSPFWKSSLVVIIEDDPQEGSDHVDSHRSLVLLASPWVKRGYVSHTHFDVSSLHKLLAHIFGLPYNHLHAKNAALPLDMFTSTPDYTPFDYKPRGFADMSCNAAGTPEALEAESWDFSEPDEQPGLGQQVYRMLHKLPGAKATGSGAKGAKAKKP